MIDQTAPTPRSGCLQALLLALLTLWFIPPLLVPGLLHSLLLRAPVLGPLLVLALHLVLYLPVVILARSRPWASIGGATFGLAAAAGFVAIRGMQAATVSEPAGLAAATLLTTLIYDLLVIAPLYARWRGVSFRDGLREIGALRPLNLRLILFALALATPFAAPWVILGALGSSAQIGLAILQALAGTLGLELLLRGFVFSAYLRRSERRWPSVAWSALVGALVALATGLVTTPASITSAFLAGLSSIDAIVLGLLLGVIQLGTGLYLPATWLVALIYQGFPLLFTDPRTDLELSFVLARAFMLGIAVVFAGVLVLARRGLVAKRQRPPMRALTRPLLICGLAWAAIGTLYASLGSPGIYEDGFVIVLKEQADLNGAAGVADRVERLWFVYTRLVETATRTQAPLRAELDSIGVRYRTYYLVNMMRVDGWPGLAARFAGRPDVARIEGNPNVRPYKYRIPELFPQSPDAHGVEPNLRRIGVPEAWALGAHGQAILVGGADTGYAWDHPALKRQYAGWNGRIADHKYHWHDAWDDSIVPFDEDGHGTHTMGTVVGDDGTGNQIGLAPAARWIGCRNMRHGLGNPASYAECMEFFLAPYPHGGDPLKDGDPARAPMVVNNSWACPAIEGCTPGTLVLAAQHLREAGIVMVVSAGNDGPACATVEDVPAIYDTVFSVGALQADDPATSEDEGDQATDFSSRGPVTADGSNRLKPDISAPGQNIRSSVPGGYANSDGTSMAGPHVAGLVALLFSADPELIGDVAGTEQIIRATAKPLTAAALACGAVGSSEIPNNTYGYGAIDVEAAVRAVVGR